MAASTRAPKRDAAFLHHPGGSHRLPLLGAAVVLQHTYIILGVATVCLYLVAQRVNVTSIPSPTNTNDPSTTGLFRGVFSLSAPLRPSPPPPRKKNVSESNVYLCGEIRGRVGNAFFSYASLVGIARANNMTLILKDKSVLNQVLANPPDAGVSARQEWNDKCSDALFLEQRKCCVLDRKLVQLPRNDHYLIHSCLISWRYFETIKEEVRTRLLVFRADVLHEADGILTAVRRRTRNATVVGMHVRRGDQAGWLAYLNGHNPVTPEYVQRAMTYFTERFPHVHFVVASQDTAWCRTYVMQGRRDVTIMEGNSAAVDVAVLARADHMIVSIGTFGWWAGYLNNGIKTYMKGFVSADSDFGNSFDDVRALDYVYPGWIPL